MAESKMKVFAEKHSTKILTGVGITGLVGTTVLAVKATPKVLDILEVEKAELEVDKLAPLDIIKLSWRPYLPAIALGVFSTSCIVGAYNINARKTATIAAACTLSETAFRTYADKTLEVVGDKAEQEIREAVGKQKILDNPAPESMMLINSDTDTICYDGLSGRYFKSDKETLRAAENTLNSIMLSDTYISLNDYYCEIGLDNISLGNVIGWHIDDGKMTFRYSSILDPKGRPCLFVEPSIMPVQNYQETYR